MSDTDTCWTSDTFLFRMFDKMLRLMFEQLLVGLVSSFRYGGSEVNASLAQSEADILHEAIKNKNHNHEEVIRILTTRSKTQLVATFNCYRHDHGIAITKVQH